VDKNKSIPVVEVVSSLCVQEVCPTGRLNKSRFVDLYRKMFPEGKSAAFYEHMFRVYDADRSGTLEFSEFIQVRSASNNNNNNNNNKWTLQNAQITENCQARAVTVTQTMTP